MSAPSHKPVDIPPCPICDGRMEMVYDRRQQTVSVCIDCHTSLTVPGSSWEVKRVKREQKATPKP
jgi:hypothetical protein